MKKLICGLVVVQIFIITFFGLSIFRGYLLSSIVNRDTSSVMLVFDDFDEYNFFLSAAGSRDITITRPIFTDEETLTIYTSDLTLGGQLRVINGRFPSLNTAEFVSNISTGEDSQVGVVNNLLPGFTLSVSPIGNVTNVSLSGVYLLHTVDLDIIEDLLNDLVASIYRAELMSVNNAVNVVNTIDFIQLLEFISISVLLFLCILAILVNFSIRGLKQNAVMMVLGFSRFSMLKSSLYSLVLTVVPAYVISYILLLIFLLSGGYIYFWGLITLYFIALCAGLSTMYLVSFLIFVSVYSHSITITNILKGKKPHLLLQFFTYGSKTAFVIAMLLLTSIAINNIVELGTRRASVSHWEQTRNLHVAQTYFIGQHQGVDGFAIAHEMYLNKVSFYKDLAENRGAFFINDVNVHFIDRGFLPYSDDDNAPPLEISPNGLNVTISLNYLDFNPIEAVGGTSVREQIIFSPTVLNLLVPAHFAVYEDEIIRLYEEYFLFSKVDIDNIYNRALDFPLNETVLEDLTINLIYVESGQYYFSPRPDIRPEYGNRIKDPIAILYTGSVHPHVLSTNIMNGFFFYSEMVDVYGDLSPTLVEHNLHHVIRSTRSVFNENSGVLLELQEQTIRLVGIVVVLVISNISVMYALVVNYFEKHKQKLSLQYVVGYGFLNRNMPVILTTSMINLAASTVVGFLFGFEILLLGMFLSLLDALYTYITDSLVISKRYVKIFKGGI